MAQSQFTKEQLLRNAKSRFSRAWIHIKWPLTRNNRPLLMDDFSAFASWLVMGNVLWVVLGTTTFALASVYSIDAVDKFWRTVRGDRGDHEDGTSDSIVGTLSGRILSQGLGLNLNFQKGSVLPKLKDGMLKFKNVQVSCDDPDFAFSASIREVTMSLSFKKWYNGHGIIDELEVFGMHAKVRTNESGPELKPEGTGLNALAMSFSKHENDLHDHDRHHVRELEHLVLAQPPLLVKEDYIFNNVRVHDSVLELFDRHDQKEPFRVSIFNCDLPQLRGDRLLLDFFNANNVTGALNDSMFTIHKRQSFVGLNNAVRFKLDGIDMASFSTANPQLKFNWIMGGKAEITADITLPAGAKEADSGESLYAWFVQKLFREFKDMSSPSEQCANSDADKSLLKGAIAAIYETFSKPEENTATTEDSEYVVVDVKVKFRDLQAKLPLHLPMASSSNVSFITLHNLRSLVGFINQQDAGKHIVIRTTVIEKIANLYNMGTLLQTRLFDAIVADMYDDFLRMMDHDEKRIIEEKASTWSHSVASHLLLLGLGVLA